MSDILLEAANWLQHQGIPMWRYDELVPERVVEDVTAGLFFLAESAGEAVGTLKFQCGPAEGQPRQWNVVEIRK